jgi:hypothetical protein
MSRRSYLLRCLAGWLTMLPFTPLTSKLVDRLLMAAEWEGLP